MPTVTLTAFDSLTAYPSTYSDWMAAAAGWGTTPNGDSGVCVVNVTGLLDPYIQFSVNGLLTDDGTTVPLDAVITSVRATYDWTFECAADVTLFFSPFGTPVAAPGSSGSADEDWTVATRAEVFEQSYSWTLAAYGTTSGTDGRVVVSDYTVHVTYTPAVPIETIIVDGVPGTLFPRVAQDVHIEDALDQAPNTASFSVTPRPRDAAPLEVEAFGVRLFTGTLQSIAGTYEGRPANLVHAVTAIDRTWLLNRRVPFVQATPPDGEYEDVSASDIVLDLLAQFAPEFSTDFVQTSLAPVTITFDGTADFATCLTRIAEAAGNCHWYIGNLDPPDLHFFYTPPPVLAFDFGSAPTDPLITTETATPAAVTGTPGFYDFRVRYRYDNGRVSGWSPISAPIQYTGLNTIEFDDLPIGADVGGVAVVSREVVIANLWNQYGAVLWRPFFDVLDNTTTTIETDLGRTGSAPLADTTFSGRPPFFSGATTRPAGPTAVTATLSATDSPDAHPTVDYNIVFALTNVFADDTESGLGDLSDPITQIGGMAINWKRVDFTDVPIGADVAGVPVVYRKLYAAYMPDPGVPDFEPVSGDQQVVAGWVIIPDNTTTTTNDDDRWFNPFFVGFQGEPPPILPNFGPDLEAGDDPEPITALNVGTLLDEPKLSWKWDWSQIRNRVFVQGFGALFVERNDFAAQLELADQEGGDGVHEFPVIVDPSLTTLAQCTARADAELQLFSKPILTVTYATRTPTKAGKTIMIDLDTPAPLHVSLRIQAVSIDQVVIAETLTPRYTVTASSVRWTLSDLLRRVL